MNFSYLLLASQAAGLGASIYGISQQNRIEGAGYRLDEESMQLRMDQERLAATQDTLSSLKELRKNLASQRAILGARGQRAGVGSAKAFEQESTRAFGEEQKTKELNQSFRKTYLESLSRLKRIEQQGNRAQRGMQLLGQSLNMVDFSSLYGLGNKGKTTTQKGGK